MTRNELIVLLLIGSVAVGVEFFSLPEVQAQVPVRAWDRKAITDAEEEVLVTQITDGGIDVLKELRSGCIEARDALVAAEAEHYRSGKSISAKRADKALKCGAMSAEQDRRAADERALKAMKRDYWCTHETLGCSPPNTDGGP